MHRLLVLTESTCIHHNCTLDTLTSSLCFLDQSLYPGFPVFTLEPCFSALPSPIFPGFLYVYCDPLISLPKLVVLLNTSILLPYHTSIPMCLQILYKNLPVEQHFFTRITPLSTECNAVELQPHSLEGERHFYSYIS